MKLQAVLEDLGLSKHEGAIYIALLKLGTSQAGPIIKTTGLHREIVYQAIERMTERGFVSIVHRNNIKSFQPAGPELLVEKAKRSVILAEYASEQLTRLRPIPGNAVTVKTFVGTDGFRKVLWELLESAARFPGKEQCLMGGAGRPGADPIEIASDFYDEYVTYGLELGVKKRAIVSESHQRLFQEKYAINPGNQLRTVKHGLLAPMLTRMTPEMVTIEIYKPEITIIQISNPLVAQSYLESFNVLWKLARSVK